MRGSIGTLLLLLQVGALAVSPADARLDVETAEIPHVESAADGPCAPSHDHRTCALCQHLAHGVAVAPAVQNTAVGCDGAAVLARVRAEAAPQPWESPRAIRAPPLA